MKEANEIAEKRCEEGDKELMSLIAEEKKVAGEQESKKRELWKTEGELRICENEIESREKIVGEKRGQVRQCEEDVRQKQKKKKDEEKNALTRQIAIGVIGTAAMISTFGLATPVVATVGGTTG